MVQTHLLLSLPVLAGLIGVIDGAFVTSPIDVKPALFKLGGNRMCFGAQPRHAVLSLSMEHSAGMLRRREAVLSIAASIFALGKSPALADGGAVVTKSSEAAVVPLNEFSDPEAGFSVALPKNYFKSSRGKKLGTLFVAGNLQSAQVVSIQRLSVEKLLADVGVVPTGDLTTWPAIGSPLKVAELLAFVRDGDAKQQSGLPSKVEEGSVKLEGSILRFKLVTPIAVKRPDKLKETQGITELNRITEVRAELTPAGEAVLVWASALEQDYVAGAGSLLRSVSDSFKLTGAKPGSS